MEEQSWLDRFAPTTENASLAKPPRRRCGRVRQRTLQSNLGEVVDMCADGMRIRSKRKPSNQMIEVQFTNFELPSALVAAIVWSKRLDTGFYEMGMKFQNTTPEIRQRLTAIAGCGGVRCFRPDPFSDAA